MNRWMNDLRFYALFKSISVISGSWEFKNDNGRLCANRTPFTTEKIPPVTCKVYTGYQATNAIDHGLPACTVDHLSV